MRHTAFRGLLAILLCLAGLAAPLAAQNFECRLGTSSACLQQGETVCSARGQCVSKDALCFDPLECDADGFTCTSNVRECQDNLTLLAEAHEELQARLANLQQEYDLLQTDARALLEEHDRLIDCIRESPVGTSALDCLR